MNDKIDKLLQWKIQKGNGTKTLTATTTTTTATTATAIKKEINWKNRIWLVVRRTFLHDADTNMFKSELKKKNPNKTGSSKAQG